MPVRVPDGSVIHVGVPELVHVHPAEVVTVIVPVPPGCGGVNDRGATVKLHAAPFWVTVNVLPAIVRLAVRWVIAVLGATVTTTVPLPLPEAPDVTVSQEVPLVAVQPHPLATDTETFTDSPAAGAEFRTVGEIADEHDMAAACVTVNG